MGYMRHHAIVVTSFDAKKIREAHTRATDFGMCVTEIVESPTNGYHTFLVAPDGSKEGWSESDHGDAERAEFKDWLRDEAFEDGSSLFDWVEVMYGDDELQVAVVDDGDANRRSPSEDSGR